MEDSATHARWLVIFTTGLPHAAIGRIGPDDIDVEHRTVDVHPRRRARMPLVGHLRSVLRPSKRSRNSVDTTPSDRSPVVCSQELLGLIRFSGWVD
jgi:hypothetical protein